RLALEPLLGVGTPVSRGIAVVFVVAGLVMTVTAILALASPAYRTLSRTYASAAPADDADAGAVPVPGAAPGQVVASASAAAALAPTGPEDLTVPGREASGEGLGD